MCHLSLDNQAPQPGKPLFANGLARAGELDELRATIIAGLFLSAIRRIGNRRFDRSFDSTTAVKHNRVIAELKTLVVGALIGGAILAAVILLSR